MPTWIKKTVNSLIIEDRKGFVNAVFHNYRVKYLLMD